MRIELLNAGYHGGVNTQHIEDMKKLDNIYFDFACLENMGGVARLVEQTSPQRVLFGSHYPFFYFESSYLKVYEARLAAGQTQAILEDNARALLGPSRSLH